MKPGTRGTAADMPHGEPRTVIGMRPRTSSGPVAGTLVSSARIGLNDWRKNLEFCDLMEHKTYKGSSELLKRFEALILARLKRSRPRQYRLLLESGELSEHLRKQTKMAVDLMGPSVDAGARHVVRSGFVWQVLYPEEEKQSLRDRPVSDHPNSLDFVDSWYNQSASLLLQASPRKTSLTELEQAAAQSRIRTSRKKRGIAKDDAAAWILGRTLRYFELQAREPTVRVKSVVGFLKRRQIRRRSRRADVESEPAIVRARTNPEKYAARHRRICERAERESLSTRSTPLARPVAHVIADYSQRILEHARHGNELAGFLATKSAHFARMSQKTIEITMPDFGEDTGYFSDDDDLTPSAEDGSCHFT